MKNLSTNTLCNVIIMIAILATFVWGFLGSAWDVSWIAMAVGVFLSIIVRMIRKDLDNPEKK